MKITLTILALGAVACSTGVKRAPAVAEMPAVTSEVHEYRGIRYADITVGNGRVAGAGKCLYVHYTGFLSNGNRIDSSHDGANEPVEFVLGSHVVIRGWEIGMEGMRTGGQRRLFIPSDLGYGDAGRSPAVPPHANLTFDVELVSVAEALDARRCPRWRDIH